MYQQHQHGPNHQCSRDPILEDRQFSFHFDEPISTIHDSELHHTPDSEFASTGSSAAIGAIAAQSDATTAGFMAKDKHPTLITRDSNSSFRHKGGKVLEDGR
ncbi:hypothetical protein INT43_008218 [Umbelopsis isabellina]|uniref:Uncharacterized protein n=1 Tax=Mortierella isabellina TaxID=91625 RepID=A0A8H7PDB9_MORIS|nr:hypothetical protein INT43_008218 [Umbelopsis isabellina]